MFVALMKEQQRAHGGDFCAYILFMMMMTDAVSLSFCPHIELLKRFILLKIKKYCKSHAI